MEDIDELNIKDFDSLQEKMREDVQNSFQNLFGTDETPRVVKVELEFMTEEGIISKAYRHNDYPEEEM
jgi:hypothetical protein